MHILYAYIVHMYIVYMYLVYMYNVYMYKDFPQLTTALFNRFKYIRADIYHADLGMNNILSSTTTMQVVLSASNILNNL